MVKLNQKTGENRNRKET